jgi:hypothetical protein
MELVGEDKLEAFEKAEEAYMYLLFQMLGVVVEDMVVEEDIGVVGVDIEVVEEDIGVVEEDIEVVEEDIVGKAYRYLYVVKGLLEEHKVVEEDS